MDDQRSDEPIIPIRKVLFLCTRNSCRSQMAEAIVNTIIGDRWEAFSAGSRPTGSIHPMVFDVLREIGIQHFGRSKNVDEFDLNTFDLVVSICQPKIEECPNWFGNGKHIHHEFPDPIKTGRVQDFRAVRDSICYEIIPLLLEHEKTPSKGNVPFRYQKIDNIREG